MAAWFLARIAIPTWPTAQAFRHTTVGFAIILAFALSAGLIGALLGYYRRSNPNFADWEDFARFDGVRDLASFVQVAYIHNAGYLGGLLGFVAALVYLQYQKIHLTKRCS